MRWRDRRIVARRLGRILARLNLHVRLLRIVRGAQYARFAYRITGNVRQLRPRIDEIANAIWESSGHMDISFASGETYFDIYLHDERDRRTLYMQHMPGLQNGHGPLTFWMGRSIEGQPVGVRLDNPRRPHLGVFGATGAGKTNALTYLLLQASLRPPDELQLVVIDPRDRLGVSDHFPNRAYERERTVEGARDALLHIRNLLAERDNDHRPRLLVVIDELGTVLARDDLLIHAFEDIIGQGRNVGIYLAVADQKPLAREIGSRGRAQIGQRLVGPVEHKLERTMVAGSSVAGSKAPGGGAFWLVHLHPPRALHIQVPLVTPEDEEQWRARPPWKIERIPQPAPEDELYPEVAEFVNGRNVVSQNDIRREFRIGVPRAQRLVKTLMEHGIFTGERAEDNSGYIVRKGD